MGKVRSDITKLCVRREVVFSLLWWNDLVLFVHVYPKSRKLVQGFGFSLAPGTGASLLCTHQGLTAQNQYTDINPTTRRPAFACANLAVRGCFCLRREIVKRSQIEPKISTVKISWRTHTFKTKTLKLSITQHEKLHLVIVINIEF